MNHPERIPGIVRWTLRLENAESLDRPVQAVQPTITSVFGSGKRGWLLRGEWLGHAIHPLLTDVTLGTWTSASLLDVFGGPGESAAAQRLVGSGLLAAAPTAWTGWAEWSAAGARDKRVGLVHAGINGLSIGIYAASWIARRRGRHAAGAKLALGGAALSSVGAYLGSHLVESRKVASHHPAYAAAGGESD
ncbi:MAG: DUF2231 domain-containing protein [Nakamurella sp.]